MLQGPLLGGTICSSPFFITLDLSYNRLNSNIPDWMNRLPQWRYFILANKGLEGEMPLQLCWSNKLQLVDLSHNNLSGKIPHCLYNISFNYREMICLTKNHKYFTSYHNYKYFIATTATTNILPVTKNIWIY